MNFLNDNVTDRRLTHESPKYNHDHSVVIPVVYAVQYRTFRLVTYTKCCVARNHEDSMDVSVDRSGDGLVQMCKTKYCDYLSG